VTLTYCRPEIAEVAVVALSSDTWGQKVACVVVLTEAGKTAGKGGKQWSPLDMRRSLRDKLANYKLPQEMKVVESLPRNAMGKSMFLN
jgi:malonyl-CoA/methylmalonyl-CoA synthetase